MRDLLFRGNDFRDTARPLRFHSSTNLIASALFFWLIAIGFAKLIEMNVMVSDVLSYWEDSLAIGEELHPFHQPGWPVLLAIGRAILPITDPVLLMQFLALAAWLASIALAYAVLRHRTPGDAWYGALFFGLYPFTGLSGVVYPLSDALAAFMVVLCLYGYMKGNRVLQVVGIALGLMVHKGLWPMLGLFALISVRDKRLLIKDVLLSGIPLLIYWLIGANYFSDSLWIVRSNFEVEIASQNTLPVFSGFLGTAQTGGVKTLLKLGILLAVFVASVWLMLSREIHRDHSILLSMVVPIVVMGMILNRHEIWAMVRFGRLLVIPLWVVLHKREWTMGALRLSPWLIAALLLAFFSNLVFLYYMEFIYY